MRYFFFEVKSEIFAGIAKFQGFFIDRTENYYKETAPYYLEKLQCLNGVIFTISQSGCFWKYPSKSWWQKRL